LLLLYYTQDFSEEFKFNNDFGLDGVDYDYSGDYINYITSKLGTLILENQGHFAQVYNFPKIIGCVELKKGSNVSLVRDQFAIYVSRDEQIPYKKSNQIEIAVGEKKEFDIMGSYYPRSISLVELENNVKSISLYKLNKKEKNPFGVSYYNPNDENCGQLSINLEPFETIIFSP